MYTEEMQKAFKSITPPNDFGVILMDNDQYLTIVVEPTSILNLAEDQKVPVVKYITDVKEALEKHGAIVQIVREAIEES